MAELYKLDDTLLTERVSLVLPGYDTLKVINRLLSGQLHVQTIGQPARICTITLVATGDAMEAINLAEGMSEPLKVTGSGKYYIGTIREAPNWAKRGLNIYEASFTMLVALEGVA